MCPIEEVIMNTRRSHAARASLARTLRLFAVAAMTAIAGCSAAVNEPEPDSEASVVRNDACDCGDYPAKECDPQVVLDYIDAHDDEANDAFYDCGGCGRGLIEAGILAKGPGPLKLLTGLDALWSYLSGAQDCRQCFEFL